MTVLVDDLVPDQLWALVEPLLPAPPRPPYGGRHRTISDRNCFAAIVFMARTSSPWRLLPARELDCGSPATCDKAYDSGANRAYLRRRGSDRESPGAGWNRRCGLGATAGESSGRCPG
jgi:transposase